MFEPRSVDEDDIEMQCTPPEVVEAASAAIGDLVPTKSKKIYEAAYQKFVTWCNSKNINVYSENVLLAYFLEMMKLGIKSSTMWSHYSMIKLLLNIRNGVDSVNFKDFEPI